MKIFRSFYIFLLRNNYNKAYLRLVVRRTISVKQAAALRVTSNLHSSCEQSQIWERFMKTV